MLLRLTLIVLVALLLLAAVSACRSNPVASSDLLPPTAQPAATAIRPPLVFTVAAPQGSQSFSLPAASDSREEAPADTPAPVETPAVEAAAETVPVVEGETVDVGPTFTPPAAPNSPPLDHYWFRRPVGDGGVVWTDKIYPYGGTRGGALRTHHGVEFNVSYSTEILAVAEGTVVVAGDDSVVAYGPSTNFYGNLVVIEHDYQHNGKALYTLYGHLSQVLVVVGQRVRVHEVIALSGATGVADGPHMHFEVRVGQNSYDSTRNPLLWLYPFPDRGLVAGRVTWPNGALAREAPTSLRRIDAPSAYAATTTYADEGVNPDDGWGENFALDDVVAGYYELTVQADGRRYRAEFWVYPYQTTFVEIVLE